MKDVTQATRVLRQIEERLKELNEPDTGTLAGQHHADDGVLSTLELTFEELQVTVEELHAKENALAEAATQLEEERSRYRRLFELSPSPSVITDANGMVAEVNTAAVDFLGLETTKLQQIPLASLFSGEDRRKMRVRLSRALRLEKVEPFRVRLPSSDGKPARVSAAPLARSNQAQTEVLWLFTPLEETDRKVEPLAEERAARERAEENEEEARFLFRSGFQLLALRNVENVAAAVAELAVPFLGDIAVVDLVDEGGLARVAVAHADPVAEETGTAQEVLARPPDPSAQGGVGDVIELSRARIASGGGAEERFADAVLRLRDGEEVPPSLRAGSFAIAPLNAGGQTLGALTVASTDPTRDYDPDYLLIRTYAQYAALILDRARRLEDAREPEVRLEGTRRAAQLLSSISHEFRTPLHSILGYCELLLDGITGELPDTVTKFIEGIRSSALHQVGLVDNLVALGKSQIGDSVLQAREVAAPELAEEVVSVARPLIRDASIDLSARLPDDDLRIRTDPRKLRQILINLVSNAIKYTESGSVELQAREEGEDHVAFMVRDTGPGIEEGDMEWVFEPFWRGDDHQRTSSHGGSGLGLSVVKTLVEQLGGEIAVESVPGEGSAFIVTLPRELEEPAS